MTARSEWLEWRRQGVGGSDVAGILGISPWSSPWAVWADKVGLTGETEPTEEMDFGLRLEPVLAGWFCERTGLYVHGAKPREWCANPVHRATLDGLVHEGPPPADAPPLGVVEYKTTGPGRKWETIPAHYVAQVQWQLHVTGLRHAWLAVLMGRRLDVHEAWRDDNQIDRLITEVDKFWSDHVLTGTPPPVDGLMATSQAIATAWPADDPEHPPASLPAELLERWMSYRALTRFDKLKLREVEQAIRVILGDGTMGEVDGRPAVTLRAQDRRGAIDEQKLLADGIDPDRYRQPGSTFRVLRPTRQDTER